jgi:hypothetical protein
MASRPGDRREIGFAAACDELEPLLHGGVRQEMVAALSDAPSLAASLGRLRGFFSANAFTAGGRRIALERVVNAFDKATRQEGFHVLHDWDGKSDRVNDTSIPVDVLDYVVRLRGGDPPDPAAVAILLDYYFIHVLELFSLRAWDHGDADANLDRLGALLASLQGPGGSGQPFAADAETLILVATSHFELHERGYDLLLQRVRTLNRAHQAAIAVGHASSMGSHLRFGFEASYARDTLFMRDDNVADYPWLCYALTTVMREYDRVRASGTADAALQPLVEALVNGLSADARAFVGEAPPSLARSAAERAEFRERFDASQGPLLDAFEAFRPTAQRYSPVSFFFNFAHNVRKGAVIDALLRGEAWNLTFNDLLSGLPDDPELGGRKELLANTLMTYARLNPDRIRGRLMPVIVYDPQAGRQAFGTMMRRLRE